MASTILGPLTTVFTPAPECTTLAIIDSLFQRAVWGAACSTFIEDAQYSFRENCYPAGVVSYFTNRGDIDSTVGIFSPGLACPQGFSTACSFSKTSSGGLSQGTATGTGADTQQIIQNALRDGETYVGCCPSNFQCDDESNYGCTYSPTLGYTFSGLTYTSSCAPVPTELAIMQEPNSAIGGGLRVPIILAATNSSTRTTAATTSTSNPPAESASESATPPSGEGSGSGLSTGAKAGVGVGVPLAVVVLVTLIFLVVRWRRNKKVESAPTSEDAGYVKPELDGTGVMRGSELRGGEVQEIDPGAGIPAEIAQGRSGPYFELYARPEELAGDAPGGSGEREPREEDSVGV